MSSVYLHNYTEFENHSHHFLSFFFFGRDFLTIVSSSLKTQTLFSDLIAQPRLVTSHDIICILRLSLIKHFQHLRRLFHTSRLFVFGLVMSFKKNKILSYPNNWIAETFMLKICCLLQAFYFFLVTFSFRTEIRGVER